MNQEKHKNILKVCEIIASLTDTNVRYIDQNKESIINLNVNDTPQLLITYFDKVDLNSVIHTPITDRYNIILSKTPPSLSYVTSNIYEDAEYAGFVVIGPFLSEEPGPQLIDKAIATLDIPITLKTMLFQYYNTLNFFDQKKITHVAKCLHHLLISLDYIENHPFEINTVSHLSLNHLSKGVQTGAHEKKEYIAKIEKKYEMENLVIHAVEKGDFLRARKVFLASTSLPVTIDQLPSNMIRNFKNISYSFNTLLRKAAERGGVHPIAIDNLSELYASRIERISSKSTLIDLHINMIHEYCELVNRQSLTGYSHFIQQVITYIRFHLDNQLSLTIIAQYMNTSSTKVSRTFTKEVGISIVTFINKSRIDEAVNLMKADYYNITEIAFKVGYNDTNYFSKIFKKFMDMTPQEYRTKLLASKIQRNLANK